MMDQSWGKEPNSRQFNDLSPNTSDRFTEPTQARQHRAAGFGELIIRVYLSCGEKRHLWAETQPTMDFAEFNLPGLFLF